VYVRGRVFGRSAGGIAGSIKGLSRDTWLSQIWDNHVSRLNPINAHRPVASDKAMCSAWLARELKRAGMSEHQSGRRGDHEHHERGTGNPG
jgi:hypothetical protein